MGLSPRARDCSPKGVAAALYISSILRGERRTPRKVADVAGVTIDSRRLSRGRTVRFGRIRNRYKELGEKLDVDIIP